MDLEIGAGRNASPIDLPDAFVRFVEWFNEGRYWESHEVLEGLWRAGRSPFYKGLIIYASAFVHARRGNPVGVRKQLAKARRYLTEYRPAYLGIDVERLLSHLNRCLALVEQEAPPHVDALRTDFPYDTLTLAPGLVSGREPELVEQRMSEQ